MDARVLNGAHDLLKKVKPEYILTEIQEKFMKEHKCDVALLQKTLHQLGYDQYRTLNFSPAEIIPPDQWYAFRKEFARFDAVDWHFKLRSAE